MTCGEIQQAGYNWELNPCFDILPWQGLSGTCGCTKPSAVPSLRLLLRLLLRNPPRRDSLLEGQPKSQLESQPKSQLENQLKSQVVQLEGFFLHLVVQVGLVGYDYWLQKTCYQMSILIWHFQVP